MTFVEALLIIIAGIILYLCMKPFQHHLEIRLRKLFRSKVHPSDKPIIDITDYKKKDK